MAVTRLYAPRPYDSFDPAISGVAPILATGTDVDNTKLTAVQAAATAAGLGTLPTSAGGTVPSPTSAPLRFRGAWQANTPYQYGDVVQIVDGSGNTLAYSANLNFTSGSSFSSTNWTELTFPGTAASLPSQTGNNGKFLTTDGSNPSWATVASGADSVTTVAASGATQTLTVGTGQLGTWDVTLTAACTLTFAGASAGTAARWRLIARQDGTGSRLITWPAAVKWRNNVVPTLSTAASAADIFEFVSVDGGTTVYGFRIDAAGIPTSILTAKGDIIAATAAAAATNLPVGSNGQVFTADSTQAAGVKWATLSTAPSAPMTLTGTSDTVQLIVAANSTQSTDVVNVKNNGGTLICRLTNQGRLYAEGVFADGNGFGVRITSTFGGTDKIGLSWGAMGTTGNGGFIYNYTYGASRVAAADNGDVILHDANVALATGATGGFTFLPSMAGTPSGTPAARTGAVACVVDTTAGKLWAYLGGVWKSVTFA